MVCGQCRAAAARIITDPTTAKVLHERCKGRGGTWCDCQHKMVSSLNPALVYIRRTKDNNSGDANGE